MHKRMARKADSNVRHVTVRRNCPNGLLSAVKQCWRNTAPIISSICVKRRKHYPKYKEEAPAVPRTPRLPGGPINGQLGGWARGQKYSSEHRKHWVRQGGIATRTRYGSAFYRKIRKLRKDYPKGYETRKTVERRRLEAAHHAKLNQTAR
jgi:hypothetical protein